MKKVVVEHGVVLCLQLIIILHFILVDNDLNLICCCFSVFEGWFCWGVAKNSLFEKENGFELLFFVWFWMSQMIFLNTHHFVFIHFKSKKFQCASHQKQLSLLFCWSELIFWNIIKFCLIQQNGLRFHSLKMNFSSTFSRFAVWKMKYLTLHQKDWKNEWVVNQRIWNQQVIQL